MMSNELAWVEIPTANFTRAVQFYSAILDTPMPTGEFMGVPHGFFNDPDGKNVGAIIHSADAVPNVTGTLIYLHVDDLDAVMARVVPAGGSVAQPQTSIGDPGTIAVIRDTEGNRVGFHTPLAR